MNDLYSLLEQLQSTVTPISGFELASERGRGTTFTIKIPLTLAIVSVLIVGAGGQRFAIPQLGVAELVRAGEGAEHRVEIVDGAGHVPQLEQAERTIGVITEFVG